MKSSKKSCNHKPFHPPAFGHVKKRYKDGAISFFKDQSLRAFFMYARKNRQRNHQENKSAYKPIIPAVEQALKILLSLAEGPKFKMRLTDICHQTGICKSKGYSILHTLMQYGFIEKDLQTKTYSLGPSLLFLSRNFLDHLYYPDVAAPFLKTLARETGGTAMFGLISGPHVFVLNQREGNANIGFRLRVGQRFHITLGAHGKAIVAFLSETERKTILSRKKLYFYGDPSRMDMKRLKEEITTCRDSGFAYEIGEVTPGVTVISAPVFGFREKLIGCIGLIGVYPKRKIEEYGTKVADVAKQISYKLGADAGSILSMGTKRRKIEGTNKRNILRLLEGASDASF
jgi:DNA-binding IclR family transcriptional regulator